MKTCAGFLRWGAPEVQRRDMQPGVPRPRRHTYPNAEIECSAGAPPSEASLTPDP